MINNPKVSVIIPVYNVEKYLRECLDSVLNQTLTDIEIICINDGSTDNSLQILEEYAAKDKRFIVISQENQGQSIARNRGIDIANGDYIFFLDSDDYLNNNILERLYATAIDTSTDYVMSKAKAFADVQEISCLKFAKKMNEKYLNFEIYDTYKITKENFGHFIDNYPCVVWGNLYKKSFINDNNLRFINMNIKREDEGWFLKATSLCPSISMINNIGVMYRIRHKSTMSNLKEDDAKAKKDIILNVKNALEYISNNNDNYYFKNKILDSAVYSAYFGIDIPFLFRFIWCKHNKRITIGFVPIYRDKISKQKRIIKILGIPVYIKKLSDKKKYIISLTSFPARINIVHLAIESLISQTYKADKIVLWLSKEEFPNREKDLPSELLELRKKGLEIDWCNDIKSYKKLIPALKKYPNDVIITADDDLIYDKKWLEYLINSYKKNPAVINAHRCHRINYINNKFCISWEYFKSKKANFNYFCTTGGGIVYPPNSFNKEVFNEKIFMRLCPTNDDLWFWAMVVLNNKKIKVIENNISDLNYINGTQENCLWQYNEDNTNNQLENVLEHYPQIVTKLSKKNDNVKLKIFEKILSIKNTEDKKYKVLTLLGIKIKFKRKI